MASSSPDHTIAGHVLIAALGEGSCGESLLAKSPDGKLRVIKIFKAMGSNRKLLHAAHARLAEAGSHPGVVPVRVVDFEARPAWAITDFLGAWDGETASPATLRSAMEPGLSQRHAWSWIRQIADALAYLHRVGVVHANLHPGNIFFTDAEKTTVAVTDFSQGWVSGVYQLDGNDAMLYASPEQLRDPTGIDQGVGGGWDVHSFGILAYRLLNGRFPFGEETRMWLEKRHLAQRQSIAPSSVLPAFPPSPKIEWVGETDDWEELARREIIESCLYGDPEKRFKDMREVVAEFDKVDEERGLREERERVLGLRRKEINSLRSIRIVAAFMAAGFLLASIAALVYAHRSHNLARENSDLKEKFDRVVAEMEAVADARKLQAEKIEQDSRQIAEGAISETTRLKETLIQSQEQADALFAIVRDRKPATHPGFKDVKQTAAELEEFYTGLVERLDKDPELEIERARAHSNLAVLVRERGDTAAARTWQSKAISSWENLTKREPSNNEHQSRLAKAYLAGAELANSAGDFAASSALVIKALPILESLRSKKTENASIDADLAFCYLEMGRSQARAGKNPEAFALYRKAGDLLHKIADQTGRYDYRSALARSYIEFGEFARGVDAIDQAAGIQRDALGHLLELVGEKPEMRLPRLDLARAYGELGEIENDAGNPEKGLEFLLQSTQMLDSLLAEEPANNDVKYPLARRLSSLARLQRDSGNRIEAEKLATRARSLAGELTKAAPDNTAYVYLESQIIWQQAELAADLSQTDAALQAMHATLIKFSDLLAKPDLDSILRRQIQRSMAYLSGDLGHRLQEAGRREDALAAFLSSATQWEKILADYGTDTAAADALAWCKERAEKLK